MFTLAARTLIIYIILIGGLRFMGKRQVGQLQVSELVVTLLLSEIAAIPIADSNIPLIFSIVPVLLLLSFEVIIPFFTSRSAKLNRFVSGSPSLIIKKGVLDQREMFNLRLNVEEVLAELRQKNITDIADVEYAILEQNGQLSVIPRTGAQPVTLDDMQLEAKKHGFAHPIVVCGQVNKDSLSTLGYDQTWLHQILAEKSLLVEDLLLYTMDDCGNETIIERAKETSCAHSSSAS